MVAVTDHQPLLDPTGIAQLREALTGAGYTSAGIAQRIGPEATAAMRRNDFRAALRATERPDPLNTLIRVFVCGQAEPAAQVADALEPLPLAEALGAGLVEPLVGARGLGSGGLGSGGSGAGGLLRAGVELEPYGDDWWVLSDVSASMRPGQPLPPEHVLGVGGASSTLANATVRRPVGAALDLGTGCGVQALHLSRHADTVTATDLSARALRFAATTAALNGLNWELLRGDLVTPVAGRRFDLVVSNPPFVVGPGTTTHTYRDSGRPGDAICAELAKAAPALLNPGGTMQFLANWVHVAGESWADRIAGWFAGSGLDAWVIQREVSDPQAYVGLWLSDAAEPAAVQPARAAEWLDWFDANKIEAVGFGLISVRAAGHDDPTVRVEDLRQAVEQPLGERVLEWFGRQDWLRQHQGPDLLDAKLRASEGLQLQQEASLGEDGWAVDRQLLVLPDGLCWTEEIDPVVLALVGGCTGQVALREQLNLLAMAHEVDPGTLLGVADPLVRHLVERGFLLPAEG